MKILMITDRMDIGGAETHILTLARSLVGRGHSVDVASAGGRLTQSLSEAEVGHIRIDTLSRDPISVARLAHRLGRLCRSGYDVIHVHSRYPAALCARALKGSGIPMVTTAHWVFENNRLTRVFSEWGDGVLAVSGDIRRYLYREYRVSPSRVRVTVNGVDANARASDGATLPHRIVHVSRLDSDRADAAFALVDIAPRLAEALGKLEIVIVGDGERASELRLCAERVNRRLGRACVRLTGALREVTPELAAGGVFVGVSRAALEAAACRLPVILAGNEGYCGALCEESFDRAACSNFCCRGESALSPDRLCRDLLERFNDSPRALLDAEYCYQRVRDTYSAERMASDAEAAYRDAIDAVRISRDGGRVMLCGYFGYGNAGDEASLEGLVRVFRCAGYRSPYVLSARPRESAALVGAYAINRFDVLKIAALMIRDRPIFCLAGGNLLQNSTSERSLLYYAGLARLAALLGCKTALIGGGIGDLHGAGARSLAAKTLKRCDALILRSSYDKREAEGMIGRCVRVSVAPDPAMLTEPIDRSSLEGADWFSGLCGRRYAVFAFCGGIGSDGRLSSLVRDVCRRLELIPVFVAMHPREDAALCRRLHVADGVIAPTLSPCELMRLFSSAALVLGGRLHSSVMAIAAQTPAVLIGRGSKKAAFADSVTHAARELGLPSPLLWLGGIGAGAAERVADFCSDTKIIEAAGEVSEKMRLTVEQYAETVRKALE